MKAIGIVKRIDDLFYVVIPEKLTEERFHSAVSFLFLYRLRVTISQIRLTHTNVIFVPYDNMVAQNHRLKIPYIRL